MSKILVAVPCFDFLMSDFCFSLAAMVAYAKATYTIVDMRGSDIVGAVTHARPRQLTRATAT
jgi:hypothetical protein